MSGVEIKIRLGIMTDVMKGMNESALEMIETEIGVKVLEEIGIETTVREIVIGAKTLLLIDALIVMAGREAALVKVTDHINEVIEVTELVEISVTLQRIVMIHTEKETKEDLVRVLVVNLIQPKERTTKTILLKAHPIKSLLSNRATKLNAKIPKCVKFG